MGKLSTHVLDTVTGLPASGLAVELVRIEIDNVVHLVRAETDIDGRISSLLSGADMTIGRYELRFFVADHFSLQAVKQSDPPFLDVVPVRFAIADTQTNYHVPLLVSPWAYSTYRGS